MCGRNVSNRDTDVNRFFFNSRLIDWHIPNQAFHCLLEAYKVPLEQEWCPDFRCLTVRYEDCQLSCGGGHGFGSTVPSLDSAVKDTQASIDAANPVASPGRARCLNWPLDWGGSVAQARAVFRRAKQRSEHPGRLTGFEKTCRPADSAARQTRALPEMVGIKRVPSQSVLTRFFQGHDMPLRLHAARRKSRSWNAWLPVELNRSKLWSGRGS